MSYITNKSFETIYAWVLTGGAQRSDSYSAYEGWWVAELPNTGSGTCRIAQQGSRAAKTGEMVSFSFWIKKISGESNLWLLVGSASEVQGSIIIVEPDGAATWLDSGFNVLKTATLDVDEWVAVRGTYTMIADEKPNIGALGTNVPGAGTWIVDQVSLEDENVITNTLYEALIDDLEDINGTGIFATTLAGVHGEPVDVLKVAKPAALVIPDMGGEQDDLTATISGTFQRFAVQLYAKTATPHATIQNLIDDVRNAVERTTSATRAASGTGWKVDNVRAGPWSEVLTSEDLSQRLAAAQITIEIEYRYVHGAA